MRLFKSRRGVSTVIATILMIMVTMVGMSVAFASVVVYSETYQSGVGSSVLEFLTIENAWQDSNGIHIWVYNAGTEENLGTPVDVTISTIYIGDNPLKNSEQLAPNGQPSIYFDKAPGVIKPGVHVEFIGHLDKPLHGSYPIELVTTRASKLVGSSINLP